jgi:hypothetical protein
MADKTIITLSMPAEAAKRLLKLFKDKDPEMMKMCKELKIEAIDLQALCESIENKEKK